MSKAFREKEARPYPARRAATRASPRTAHSSNSQPRQSGKARNTQIGARFDPAATPSSAMASAAPIANAGTQAATRQPPRKRISRSEEHKSELQSLMRISNAVSCLQK